MSRRLRWVLALLLLGASCLAGAQNVEFRAPPHAADADTPAVMRDLAERILPVYQENDQNRYLDTLSALQLVAGSYAAATASRQQLREREPTGDVRHPEGRAILLDIYAAARDAQQANKLPFAQSYSQAFQDTLGKLGDRDAYTVTSWRGPSVTALRDALQGAFDQRRGRDAITVPDAVDLIRLFLQYEAARLSAPLLGGLDAADEERRYVAEEHVSIPTSGGARIAALLVRPKSTSGPLPALLEFTIYVNSPNYARECAAHGYVGIIAYTRENADTPYRVAPFQSEGDDARAVINWIIKQPWSDGRVGMYGSSYSGFTQWAAATRLPPALRAIAASSPNAPGIDFPMRGNIFRNSAYRWAYNVTNRKGWDDTYNDQRWLALERKWYESGKSYFEFDHTEDRPNLYFHRWLHHPSYDGFWQRLVPDARQMARIDIPILTTAGYYGGDVPGALYYFAQHQAHNPHADQTLLIGPYDDGAMQRSPLTVLRGYPLDEAAMIDLRELRYQWFDSVFKGAPRPALLSDRINYELMGANEWRHAASLASMADTQRRYYLDAAPSGDGHALLPQKRSDTSFVRQTVSFADRSDSSWQPPYNLLDPVLRLHNAVKFISEPLAQPLDIGGQISGRLDFTPNHLDADLTFAVYEALPDGQYLALYDPVYAFRASYAGDRVHRHLLKAGERQQLRFTVERLTSRRLQAGSRIVVLLGINKTPEQQINYGGGDDVSAESLEDYPGPLAIRWYSDSYIELPVQKDTAPAK
jgi:putative CocE/NonD family hydrolase